MRPDGQQAASSPAAPPVPFRGRTRRPRHRAALHREIGQRLRLGCEDDLSGESRADDAARRRQLSGHQPGREERQVGSRHPALGPAEMGMCWDPPTKLQLHSCAVLDCTESTTPEKAASAFAHLRPASVYGDCSRGSCTVAASPPAGRFARVISPPWARTIDRAIASPSPTPPVSRLREPSSRTKGSKTFSN